MHDSCFNCGAPETRLFYGLDGIPVHSCLLMPTRDQATDYPRGDLRLVFCSACGFIQNAAFDPTVHNYSPQYEETQSFSPRFNEFVDELVRRYDSLYGLAGKTVLEIGCGKGEFLVRMCELGECRGIGIDPGYRPERTDSSAADRLEFIQGFYSERYTDLQADIIVCRHTLEHIQPTREFLQMVRRSIGDRADTVVCFELPDIERVLQERAFWDIYYEHCSYFSETSLRILFESCGFEVISQERVYDDQYLLIDARPTKMAKVTRSRSSGSRSSDTELAQLTQLVNDFEREQEQIRSRWHSIFAEAKAKGRKTVIWGSGSKAVAFLTSLGLTDEVAAVTDINPHRHGMHMPGTGHRIVSPSDLPRIGPDLVVAMNAIYRDEITRDLRRLGLDAELVAV